MSAEPIANEFKARARIRKQQIEAFYFEGQTPSFEQIGTLLDCSADKVSLHITKHFGSGTKEEQKKRYLKALAAKQGNGTVPVLKSSSIEVAMESLYFGLKPLALARIAKILDCSRAMVSLHIIENYGHTPKEEQKKRYLEALAARQAAEQAIANKTTQCLDIEAFLPPNPKRTAKFKNSQAPRGHLYSALRRTRILEEHIRNGTSAKVLADKYQIDALYVNIIINKAIKQAKAKVS